MRLSICAIFLSMALPAFAQDSLKQDFRNGKFDRELMVLGGPTPEKFFTQELDGLHLRYTGQDVPPSNNTSSVVWQFHARGDFVTTAKYEIFKVEPPKQGWAVGAEMYLRLKNANKDGVSFGRVINRDGDAMISFSYMTNENGKRVPKNSRQEKTTDRSLQGSFRLAREGTILIASFAEADDEFQEFQRTEIGSTDIDLIRIAGIGGGDPNAVLDMRFQEFNLQGKDLGYKGRDFKTPLPKAIVVAEVPNNQHEVPLQVPIAEAERSRGKLLLLVGIFFMILSPLIVIGMVLLFLRFRKATKEADPKSSR